jgi:hypothetical protein
MKRILTYLLFAIATVASVSAPQPVQAQVKFFMVQASAGGGSGTMERQWAVKPANQYMATTQYSGWTTLPGSADNSITAGTTWLLRDITNSSTSSISFVATDYWLGSGNSVGNAPPGGTNTGVFCIDVLSMGGWVTTSATTETFKITGLTAGKYYDIGLFASTENYKGNAQSASFTSGGSISSWTTGNNYGTCGPGDDWDDPVIHWVTNQQPTAGEISITLTRTAGTEVALSGVFIKQWSGAH